MTGHVIACRRMKSSPSGNPRWAVTFQDGSHYTTKPNTLDAYSLSRDFTGPVEYELNSKNHITHIRRLP